MGRTFEVIDSTLAAWIESQSLFFVSTAPNDPTGCVNVSPKGGTGLFRVLGPNEFAYLDLVGSGAETIAHLRENGRIVAMFCAFEGAPKIIRLHGTGQVHQLGSDEYQRLLDAIAPPDDIQLLARSVIVMDVTRISDSCGFMVPKMELTEQRDQLLRWGERQSANHGKDWKERYVQANNAWSIDGLPALDFEKLATAEDLAGFTSEGRAL